MCLIKSIISGVGNFCLIHVSLVPVLNVVGEQVNFNTAHVVAIIAHADEFRPYRRVLMSLCHLCLHVQKTKPTQHSVRGLRSLGLMPHILACRSTTVSLFFLICISTYTQVHVNLPILSCETSRVKLS